MFVDALAYRKGKDIELRRNFSTLAALAWGFSFFDKILWLAFKIAGDPDAEQDAASVEVYLESPASADEAFAAISTQEGYRELLEGVYSSIASGDRVVHIASHSFTPAIFAIAYGSLVGSSGPVSRAPSSSGCGASLG